MNRPVRITAFRRAQVAFVAALLPALVVCAPVLSPGVTHADDTSVQIVSNPTDGHLRLNGEGNNWETLHSATDGAEVFDNLRYVKINTRPDIIYRGYLFFDTSQLPEGVTPTKVYLHIYAKCTGDLDNCGLYVLACPPGYPHEPLQSADIAVPWDQMTQCAYVPTDGWTQELAYRVVALTDPSIINTSGTTALCLVERRDYENAMPDDLHSENEIKLYSYEEGPGYQPYLEVDWGNHVGPALDTTPPGGGPTDIEAGEPAPGSSSSGRVQAVAAAGVLAAVAGSAVFIRRRRQPSG